MTYIWRACRGKAELQKECERNSSPEEIMEHRSNCNVCNQENNLDPGFRVKSSTTVLPTSSDCIVFYSSFKDHAPFRCPSAGALMIESLYDVVDQHYKDRHFLQMMTLVNAGVESKLSLYNKQNGYQKKHFTEVRCNTTTKFLKF